MFIRLRGFTVVLSIIVEQDRNTNLYAVIIYYKLIIESVPAESNDLCKP